MCPRDHSQGQNISKKTVAAQAPDRSQAARELGTAPGLQFTSSSIPQADFQSPPRAAHSTSPPRRLGHVSLAVMAREGRLMRSVLLSHVDSAGKRGPGNFPQEHRLSLGGCGAALYVLRSAV